VLLHAVELDEGLDLLVKPVFEVIKIRVLQEVLAGRSHGGVDSEALEGKVRGLRAVQKGQPRFDRFPS
jgi:hypothetical protein